jgi:hypothetical protein
MVRSPASIRGQTANTRDGAATDGEDSASGGGLRKLLLGLGLVTVAYVAVRRLRSGGQSADDSDDWHQLSIGESVDGEAPDEEAQGENDGESATASTQSDTTGENVDPEIEQRTEENVDEEPAEPGEMNVDEEVVEEVLEDDTDETDEE